MLSGMFTHKFGSALVATALLAATPGIALAVDSMRCGSRLARVGDGKDKVRTFCGEPSAVSFEGGWPKNPDEPKKGLPQEKKTELILNMVKLLREQWAMA